MRNGVLIPVAAILVIAAGCGSSEPAPVSQPAVVSATLSAASLPKGGRHASGTAVLGLNTTRRKICWTITLAGIHGPISAHLRKGPAHQVGPVIVSFGQRFVRSGCAPASPSVIADLGKHPSAYYVDVATRQNLDGALRGQLHAGS